MRRISLSLQEIAAFRNPNFGLGLDRQSWTIPPLFAWLQAAGAVPEVEMFRTFNMGVGLILVCSASDADATIGALRAAGEWPWVIGSVV